MNNKSLNVMSGYLSVNAPGISRNPVECSRFPAIAITRQVGARATTVGGLLIGKLQAKCESGTPPWTLFGKELIHQVLRDSNLPETLAKFFPEEGSHSWRETVEELVGLHPSSFDINRRCHETIVNLFRLGHVIVVGRCGNMLAADMPNVLRVRLVGSLEKRIAYLERAGQFDKGKALAYAKKEDLLRRRYANDNFNVSNVDDPLLYDLVVNTDGLSDELIVKIIEDASIAKSASSPALSRL